MYYEADGAFQESLRELKFRRVKWSRQEVYKILRRGNGLGEMGEMDMKT
jgi:hypothetical protein